MRKMKFLAVTILALGVRALQPPAFREVRGHEPFVFSEDRASKSFGFSEDRASKSFGFSEDRASKPFGFSEDRASKSFGFSEDRASKSFGFSEDRASESFVSSKVKTHQGIQCGDHRCQTWEYCVMCPVPLCKPPAQDYDKCGLSGDPYGRYGFFPPCAPGYTCNPENWACEKETTCSSATSAAAAQADGSGSVASSQAAAVSQVSSSVATTWVNPCRQGECYVLHPGEHCAPHRTKGQLCSPYDDRKGRYVYYCGCAAGLWCNTTSWSCELSIQTAAATSTAEAFAFGMAWG